MLITGKNNEKFLCQIPPHSPRRRLSSPPPPQANSTASNTTDPQAVRSTTTILSEAIKALAPMKSNCLYILQGWWTFEFCHASHIRQFHQDQPTEQQPNPPKFEFMMGRFDLDTMTSAELGESSSSGAVGGLRGRYVSIRVRDGTVCDLTGKKRETQVKVVNYYFTSFH
jgi:protein OS-9